jgi:hypothetical protein
MKISLVLAVKESPHFISFILVGYIFGEGINVAGTNKVYILNEPDHRSGLSLDKYLLYLPCFQQPDDSKYGE